MTCTLWESVNYFMFSCWCLLWPFNMYTGKQCKYSEKSADMWHPVNHCECNNEEYKAKSLLKLMVPVMFDISKSPLYEQK